MEPSQPSDPDTSPWRDRQCVEEPLVRSLLHSQFPDLKVEKCRLLGEGWDSAAWLIDEEWVFRFPLRQMGADCIDSEINVLPQIVELLPLRISCPRFVGRPDDMFPWPFAGYRLIIGDSICDRPLDDSSSRNCVRDLAQFLRALHDIDALQAEQAGAGPDTLRRLDVAMRAGKARVTLTQAAGAGALGDAKPWFELLDRIVELSPVASPRCLVHGDLYSKHVLTTVGGSVTGVIDWGDVHIGDPAVDLAIIVSVFSKPDRDVFFEIYGEPSSRVRDLAVMRAIHHSAVCLVYALNIGDRAFEEASRTALYGVLDE